MIDETLEMDGLLKGSRVVEPASCMAAPSRGLGPWQMGAKVIRLEMIKGGHEDEIRVGMLEMPDDQIAARQDRGLVAGLVKAD